MLPSVLPLRYRALRLPQNRPLPTLMRIFLVRFDRLMPTEKSIFGPRPSYAPDHIVAVTSPTNLTSLAAIRGSLLDKGMIWSRSHGDTAFTVRMFDEFMRRIMLGDQWRRS